MSSNVLTGLTTIVCALAVTVSAASADAIRLKDGRRFEGRVVHEAELWVEFEVHIGTMRSTHRFERSQIEYVSKGEPAGEADADGAPAGDSESAIDELVADPADADADQVRYVMLPLHGDVGHAINAEVIEKALRLAERYRLGAVILRLDSPGGSVTEKERVIEVLEQYRQTHEAPLVALVEQEALSAAAILAVACDRIYMKPGTTIGAATVVAMDERGVVSSVELKHLSAYSAKDRSVAERAGHDSALVAAMTNPNQELSVGRDREGNLVLLQGGPQQHSFDPRFEEPPRLLVTRGRPLTLTAEEAVEFGLADAVVTDLGDVLIQLDLVDADEAEPVGAMVEAHLRRIDVSTRQYEDLMAHVSELPDVVRKVKGSQDLPEWQIGRYAAQLNGIERNLVRLERLARRYAWIAEQFDAEMTTMAERFPPERLGQEITDPLRHVRKTIHAQLARLEDLRPESARAETIHITPPIRRR